MIAALAAAATAAVTLAVLFSHRSVRITRESYALIREGMARAEVEAVIGGPPGDYATTPEVLVYDHTFLAPCLPRVAVWKGDAAWIPWSMTERDKQSKRM